MKIVIVNYGKFVSNSGGHTAAVASNLASRGHDVWVVGEDDPASLDEYGDIRFKAATFDEVLEGDADRGVFERPEDGGALIHGWTPREQVRLVVERLQSLTGWPYVVHLEDNEEVITSTQVGLSKSQLAALSENELDERIPLHLAHPRRSVQMLRETIGATVIVDALRRFVPEGVPVHLLEPGVDAETFAPQTSELERARVRRELYIPENAFVVVYTGNTHPANAREIFSLYVAVLIARRRGLNVVLVRTGKDYGGFDASYNHLQGEAVRHLGHVPRSRLLELLQIADAFVQPGAVNDFNTFRLPSKVPEFLALGKPVILPRTNIGLRLIHGENALLLDRGDGEEIADQLARVIEDPALHARLSAGARKFALRELSWPRNVALLEGFYSSLLDSRCAARSARRAG